MKRAIARYTVGATIAAGFLAVTAPAHAAMLPCGAEGVTGGAIYACGSVDYPTDDNGLPSGAPTDGSATVSSAGAPIGGDAVVSGDSSGITLTAEGNDSNPAPANGSVTVQIPPQGLS